MPFYPSLVSLDLSGMRSDSPEALPIIEYLKLYAPTLQNLSIERLATVLPTSHWLNILPSFHSLRSLRLITMARHLDYNFLFPILPPHLKRLTLLTTGNEYSSDCDFGHKLLAAIEAEIIPTSLRIVCVSDVDHGGEEYTEEVIRTEFMIDEALSEEILLKSGIEILFGEVQLALWDEMGR